MQGYRSRCGGSLGKNSIFLHVKLSKEWKTPEREREPKVNLLINPDEMVKATGEARRNGKKGWSDIGVEEGEHLGPPP